MVLMCLGCKQPLDVPDIAPPAIINLTAVSVLIVEHAQQLFCPNCGLTVVVTVAGANLALAAQPVAPAKQAPIILAPNGMKV